MPGSDTNDGRAHAAASPYFARRRECDVTRRFVILAAQRTGSYMLASALDAIDGVTCYGELFRKRGKGVEADYAILQKLGGEFDSVAARHQRHAEFLDAVFAHTEAGLAGFKLMLRQAPAVQEAVLGSPDYRKIVLDRPNVLALYSSHLIAKQTGIGFMRRGEKTVAAKVEFDSAEFRGFWRRYRRKYEQLGMQLADGERDDVIRVEYLDLLQGRAFARVLAFLGIDAEPDISSYLGTQKRNRSEIVQRFSNPEDVIDALRGLDRAEWLNEN